LSTPIKDCILLKSSELYSILFVDIRKQIIWGNKHITFENKPIFLKIG
jgi:hypothetical protein